MLAGDFLLSCSETGSQGYENIAFPSYIEFKVGGHFGQYRVLDGTVNQEDNIFRISYFHRRNIGWRPNLFLINVATWNQMNTFID